MGFWTGAILGAIGGAAYGLVSAPRSGEEARADLLNSAEETVASMTGMELWTSDEKTDTADTQPVLDATDSTNS